MPQSSQEGIVYIFKNEAMPGYIKIGLTRADDVRERLRQLDNTSVPMPFEQYYSARVPDCARLERTLHFVFGEKRVRTNREFFRVEPDLVKAIIELVAISEEQAIIAPSEALESLEEARAERAPRLTLQRLGISPGAILQFIKDPDITCTVAQSNKVEFQGEIMSVSAAALKAIHDMGYNWPTVNGFEYWMHDGMRLKDRLIISDEARPESATGD